MSFPRYPEYKSQLSAIAQVAPAHWKVMDLRWVARLQSGESITSERILPEGEYPVFGGGGLRGYTNAYTHDGEFPLIGRQGALCGNINIGHGRFWASEHSVVVSPTDGVNTRWLAETLRTMNLNQYSVSAAQPGLSVDVIRRLSVPVPPPEEQQAIATFLDRETTKIDALVAEQERLIALLKEKRQAVISHAVTKGLNPDAPMQDSTSSWIGNVPAHWEYGPLKRFCKVVDCKHVTADFVDDGYPLVSIREVQSRWVSLDSAKKTTERFFHLLSEGGRRLVPGDLVFSRNATVGEVAQIAPGSTECAMGQDVVLIRCLPGVANPDFVQCVLRSLVVETQLGALMIGSTFKRVNVEEIRSLQIAMPPLHEAVVIADAIQRESDSIEHMIDAAYGVIRLLSERRNTLITAAVTGQIDVRGLAQAEAA